MLETTLENFDVKEVSGDKGYLSYKNARTIATAGATPFIAFKSNSSAGDFRKEGVAKTKAWTDMPATWTTVTLPGAKKSTITNLPPGATYAFQVRALGRLD